MALVANILIGLIALEHLYILWMEMFAWEAAGKKTFKGALPEELFKKTKGLAANQGLYNGFLAAGLLWLFFITDHTWRVNIAVFFLVCVSVAGIFGAVSASRQIFFVQALPALIALLMLFLANLK